jgi:L-asparaginase
MTSIYKKESFLSVDIQSNSDYISTIILCVSAPLREISFTITTMPIKIFVTGGTFDKEYNELNGQLFFKETHLNEMLSLGRSRIDVHIATLMMIDSLDMTDADRKIILDNCVAVQEDKIVITHGTDTMVETACYLAGKIRNKTIVLTGAMIPYKFGSSDGLFNLGSALAFVQTLPKGIYISMNGRYFLWNNAKK